MKMIRFLLWDLWVKAFLWLLLFPFMLLFKAIQYGVRFATKEQREAAKRQLHQKRPIN